MRAKSDLASSPTKFSMPLSRIFCSTSFSEKPSGSAVSFSDSTIAPRHFCSNDRALPFASRTSCRISISSAKCASTCSRDNERPSLSFALFSAPLRSTATMNSDSANQSDFSVLMPRPLRMRNDPGSLAPGPRFMHTRSGYAKRRALATLWPIEPECRKCLNTLAIASNALLSAPEGTSPDSTNLFSD